MKSLKNVVEYLCEAFAGDDTEATAGWKFRCFIVDSGRLVHDVTLPEARP